MKALTVKQPYAAAIFTSRLNLRKDIENRSWHTNVRGTVAIHAGLTRAEDPKHCSHIKEKDLVFGAIIGVVDLIEVVTEHDSHWFEDEYGFVLRNPRKLPEPILIQGRQLFWSVPDSVEKKIRQQLGLEWFLREK